MLDKMSCIRYIMACSQVKHRPHCATVNLRHRSPGSLSPPPPRSTLLPSSSCVTASSRAPHGSLSHSFRFPVTSRCFFSSFAPSASSMNSSSASSSRQLPSASSRPRSRSSSMAICNLLASPVRCIPGWSTCSCSPRTASATSPPRGATDEESHPRPARGKGVDSGAPRGGDRRFPPGDCRHRKREVRSGAAAGIQNRPGIRKNRRGCLHLGRRAGSGTRWERNLEMRLAGALLIPLAADCQLPELKSSSGSEAAEHLTGRRAHMSGDIRLIAGARMSGPAVTLRLVRDEKASATEAGLAAIRLIEGAPKGSVVVAALDAEKDFAVFGSTFAALARTRNLAGFLVDGAVRDLSDLKRSEEHTSELQSRFGISYAP